MRFILLLFMLFNINSIFILNAQDSKIAGISNAPYVGEKGQFYFYWGWNRAWFTNSDITFTGEQYEFVLQDIVASDRQTPFEWDVYFHPTKITLPQTNARFGYYYKNNWDISIGIDHMKYVLQQNQTTKISGFINNSETEFDGVYKDDDIVVVEKFLTFEHTDGLNYVNIELRNSGVLWGIQKYNLAYFWGAGIGGLYPKTNATIFGGTRYDDFHLSGIGVDVLGGLKINFLKHFFLQSEVKGGYISMPNIRTTISKSDKASQQFWFLSTNFLLGGTFRLFKK